MIVQIPDLAVYVFTGGVLSILGVTMIAISFKAMWWIVNNGESAFKASATAIMTYMYFTIKYRCGNKPIEEFNDSIKIGDYIIRVEKDG